ncbi:MAG: hypothetical protein AMK73_09420 [Planctomycetes bacterium SM23_32]|nr:MAG: hypothetical protein AMK73_09420 [Planctomycetes bacterium SM23_32]
MPPLRPVEPPNATVPCADPDRTLAVRGQAGGGEVEAAGREAEDLPVPAVKATEPSVHGHPEAASVVHGHPIGRQQGKPPGRKVVAPPSPIPLRPERASTQKPDPAVRVESDLAASSSPKHREVLYGHPAFAFEPKHADGP